jgi:non-specific serine/threonine protein kinase
MRRLLDGGVPVPLSRAPSTFSRRWWRAGHLVTKDELLERVWPRVIVEEGALHVQISSLRKIIGRDGIMTVMGRGLSVSRSRLICVEVDDVSGKAAPARRNNLPQPLSTILWVVRSKSLSSNALLRTSRC